MARFYVVFGIQDDDIPEGSPDPIFANKVEALAYARAWARDAKVSCRVEIWRIALPTSKAGVLRAWANAPDERETVAEVRGTRPEDILCRECEAWHEPGGDCIVDVG